MKPFLFVVIVLGVVAAIGGAMTGAPTLAAAAVLAALIGLVGAGIIVRVEELQERLGEVIKPPPPAEPAD